MVATIPDDSPRQNPIEVYEETGTATTSKREFLENRNLIVEAGDKYPDFGARGPHCVYKATRFQAEFQSVLDDDINGSFYCDYDCKDSRVWPQATWSCFKVKEVRTAYEYKWKQPILHVEWNPITGRQLLHVFGLGEDQKKTFISQCPSRTEQRCNPFSWHATFARILLEQYNAAFWMLRHIIRGHEKSRLVFSRNLNGVFPLLHDIARHVFHYQETIEVAEHTLQVMVAEQARWRGEDAENIQDNLSIWLTTRQRIILEEKRAHSLKTRAKSLNDRHQNEINLEFGRDARTDSNMMKTVAVVSMFYLPGTFVSGIFGTNFFNFEVDRPNKFSTADDFWMYWAVTIPLTLATIVIWALWHWRETYPRWWQKVFGNTSQVQGASPVGNDGLLRRSSTTFVLQRIRTVLGLEMPRRESV
ncbi:hypothetical protein BJX61DRAFT_537875 [Aspergillus egyptiacus]|nr:hypothetical protein BJX61DRAFT_537875 [Aspergillus egyptiacus]